MVTNYSGHIMKDHTDAYIIGKLDPILTSLVFPTFAAESFGSVIQLRTMFSDRM